MNDLAIALESLGGVVLAGVIAHGAWSARNAGPKRATQPVPREEPREPVLAEPTMVDESALPSGPDLPALRPARKPVARLDALIDALATLSLEAPIIGEMVQPHLPATRRVGSKVFMIEGLDVESGEWETPVPGGRYSEFQAGVQLANRTGALNEIEYSEFAQRVQTFAEGASALADMPDMLEAMARARELDAFASQHDAQLAVNLRARAAAWSVGYIQEHARRHGFVNGMVPGRLVYPAADEGAPPVLTLTFDSQAALSDEPDVAAVRAVTVSFDVPQTDRTAEPFAAWQASAQALAIGMDADIVDDNGRPLDADGFAAIGGQLGQLYDALAARDLAAGSAAARRLFS